MQIIFHLKSYVGHSTAKNIFSKPYSPSVWKNLKSNENVLVGVLTLNLYMLQKCTKQLIHVQCLFNLRIASISNVIMVIKKAASVAFNRSYQCISLNLFVISRKPCVRSVLKIIVKQ